MRTERRPGRRCGRGRQWRRRGKRGNLFVLEKQIEVPSRCSDEEQQGQPVSGLNLQAERVLSHSGEIAAQLGLKEDQK